MRMSSYVLLVTGTIFFFSSCQKHIPGICNCSPGDYVSSVSVFSTGLNNPRGLKFGPDGYLYVAEGGIGGAYPAGNCMGVLPPVGPYTGSDNDLYAVEPNHGELDKITPKGAVSRVIDILAFEGHIVPTAVSWHNGYFYVGNLDLFPITAGRSIRWILPAANNRLTCPNKQLNTYRSVHYHKVVGWPFYFARQATFRILQVSTYYKYYNI